MTKLRSLLRSADPLMAPFHFQGHQFPGIWQEMMPKELFQLSFPAERRATCMNCPKSCYEGYRADYRCCTYHPRISNFLLGLGAMTEAGDAAIDRLLKLGMLTPEGMYSTPAQWIDFLDDQDQDAFGRSEKVLCPMLNPSNGYCDVHAFRNSVCSTFFCISDHGKTGENFWVQVQTLGSQIELVLAQWALRELGFDVDRYIKAFDSLASRIHEVSTSTGWTEEALDLLWGEYRGREKELMILCAEKIVEARERLWEIACTHGIKESRSFDEAMDTLVPEHLEDEVEDVGEGLEVDGDNVTLSPEETWDEVLEAHLRLWDVPTTPMRLSPYLSFVQNQKSNDEELYYSAFPHFAIYQFPQKNEPEWSLALTDEQKSFLEEFQNGKIIDLKAMRDKGQGQSHMRVFLSEALNKKMLWPQR